MLLVMNDNVTFGLGCKSYYFFPCAFANLIGYKDVPNSGLVDFRTLCLPVYHRVLSFILILNQIVDFVAYSILCSYGISEFLKCMVQFRF